MRPFNVFLVFALPLGFGLVLGFTEGKRKGTQITTWVAVVLVFLLGFAFTPDEGIGPATWGELADSVLPDGYSQHSVETWISVGDGWIGGETKACKSYPLIPPKATYSKKGRGYAVDSFYCDDGAMHMVKTNLYGHLYQPEHRIAYWQCTRESESFTCRQTGGE
jgi:hypothetical protein